MTGVVTILVPTRNRPAFAIRMLRYYADSGFDGIICLTDGSSEENVDRVAREIQILAPRLKVTHLLLPGASIAESLQKAGEIASTPFVVFAGDDDYLIPDTLSACVTALERDSALCAVHGTGVVAVLADSSVHGSIQGLTSYRQPVLKAGSAADRLVDHLKNYSVTLFSVHRIATWRAMFTEVAGLNDMTFAAELLPCCLTAVYGKVGEIARLGVVRQHHAERVVLPSAMDWIVAPGWAPSYRAFEEFVGRELAARDAIGQSEAREIVRKAFWVYLAKLLRKQWQGRYGCLDRPSLISRIIASGSSRFGNMTDRVLGPNVSLDKFRTPSSSHFADFDHVYRSLTSSA